MRRGSTSGPTAAMWPHASAPCIRGKLRASPVHPASAALASEVRVLPVADAIVFEYQPTRVLMSVLLMAAAQMRDQDFARRRDWNGTFRCEFQPVSSPVTLQEHGFHILWNDRLLRCHGQVGRCVLR